jgi:hypothetical protein
MDSELGWSLFEPCEEQDEVVAIHAIPTNDIYTHQMLDSGQCACNPQLDEEADGLFFIHRAFDGREEILNGRRKPS